MKSILVFVAVLLSFVSAASIVKINDRDYSASEFQQYVNFLKDSGGVDAVKAYLADPEGKNSLLNSFIDDKVLLIVANKAGYTRKSDKMQKRWNDIKDTQLLQYFLKVQTSKNTLPPPTEDDLKTFYKKLNPNPSRTFESLNEQEKQQVGQYIMMDRQQNDIKNYLAILEKKYKVSRKPLSDYFVAEIEGIKIKQATLTDEVEKRLILTGKTKDESLKANPQEYEKLRLSVRDELIAQELLKLEIANTKFTSGASGLFAMDFLFDDMIKQSYLAEEIISKIAISDNEINEAYNRNKQALAGKPFDQVHAYLKSEIQKGKFQRTYPTFLAEKREECVIKRDKSELDKIQ